MKVIQTETKNHATKTFVANTPDDEARILVAILKKETSLKPHTEEEITKRVRSAYGRELAEQLDIPDEVVPSLPATLQKKVVEVKTRYNERIASETRKNDNRKKLVEIVSDGITVTKNDLTLLKELADEAQGVEDDIIGYSGGWGTSRKIYTVFPVTKA